MIRDLKKEFGCEDLAIDLPELAIKSDGKYEKLCRKILISALQGLIEEIQSNHINSDAWKTYRIVIENVTKYLESKEKP